MSVVGGFVDSTTIVPICNIKSVVDLGELLPPVPVSNFLKVGGGGTRGSGHAFPRECGGYHITKRPWIRMDHLQVVKDRIAG